MNGQPEPVRIPFGFYPRPEDFPEILFHVQPVGPGVPQQVAETLKLLNVWTAGTERLSYMEDSNRGCYPASLKVMTEEVIDAYLDRLTLLAETDGVDAAAAFGRAWMPRPVGNSVPRRSARGGYRHDTLHSWR